LSHHKPTAINEAIVTPPINLYKKFKEDAILIWYDGPLLRTMTDKKGNHYIEHNDDYSAFAKVTIDDLLQILRNEKPINFAFENSNEKYECFICFKIPYEFN